MRETLIQHDPGGGEVRVEAVAPYFSFYFLNIKYNSCFSNLPVASASVFSFYIYYCNNISCGSHLPAADAFVSSFSFFNYSNISCGATWQSGWCRVLVFVFNMADKSLLGFDQNSGLNSATYRCVGVSGGVGFFVFAARLWE